MSDKQTDNKLYIEKSDFAEFTFEASDGEVYYCKRTLALNSEFFKNMFTHKMEENIKNSMNCSDLTKEEIIYLLRVLDGFDKVNSDNKISVVKLANMWEFPNLVDKCIEYLNEFYWDLTIISEINQICYTEGIYGEKFKKLVVDMIAHTVRSWIKASDLNEEIEEIEKYNGDDTAKQVLIELLKKSNVNFEGHNKLLKEYEQLQNKYKNLEGEVDKLKETRNKLQATLTSFGYRVSTW